MRPTTLIFLILLGLTAAIWILRGLALLSFIPGGILWLLLFSTIGAGVVDMLQRAKRW